MAKSLVDNLGDQFSRAGGLCRGPAEDLIIGGVDKAPEGFTDDDFTVDVESAREIGAMLKNPRKFFETWPDMTRRAYNFNEILSVLAEEVQVPLAVRMVGNFGDIYEGRHRDAWVRICNLLISGKLVIPGMEAAVAEAREKRGDRLYDIPFMLDKSTADKAAQRNAFMNIGRRIPTARDKFHYVTEALTRAETIAERTGKAVDIGKVLGSIGMAGDVPVATVKHWAELRDCADEVLDAMFDGRITPPQAVALVKGAPGKVAQRAAVAALPTTGHATAAVVAETARAAMAAVAGAKESGEAPKAAAREAAKKIAGKRAHLTVRDLRKLVESGKGATAAHRAVRGVLDMLTRSPDDLTAEQIAAVPGLAEYLSATAPDAE